MTTPTVDVDHRAHLAFYLTGTRLTDALHEIGELRPALFAPYADLTRLRYDYPIVLLRHGADQPFEALSAIVDRVCAKIGGTDKARKILHRHERVIRNLVANGTAGTLGKLWKLATPAEDAAAVEILDRAGNTLDVDGQVLDCDARMPARLLIRAWRFAQERKLATLRDELERLVLKLRNILAADAAGSAAWRTPARLKASVGTGFEDAFDFDALSALLTRALPDAGLSAARRARIEGILEVLESQQFVPARNEQPQDCHQFIYTSCEELEEAYSDRLSELTAVARAMAIGALEAQGEYSESLHDELFEAFGANGLTQEDLAQFPHYLLWLYAPLGDEYGELMRLLAGNLPVKVMVQFDDLLEPAPNGTGQLNLSLRSKQLADLAIGLNNVYVLQSTASNLVRMKERLLSGLAQSGPALFSIYSGAPGESRLPAYIVSAAALESRAFPAFTYDPSAGTDWAARFSLDGNPQPERDWPVQPFVYEDEKHERVELEVEFTLADFMVCDPRYVKHFAKVPAAHCNGNLLTVHEWVSQNGSAHAGRVPALMMIDRENVLQRVIVDSRTIEEAKRCRAVWRSLQELGGIHNSHAERRLAREKHVWDENKKREIDALKREAKPAEAAQTAASAAPSPEPVAPAGGPPAVVQEVSREEAYIDTPRCTTCEECMHINNKLFLYDGNKQAYIADLKAGTYRQLVEAAELCQVSIIHPGKPFDSSEPGIEELVERAQVFN
jgi:hypothetical protein